MFKYAFFVTKFKKFKKIKKINMKKKKIENNFMFEKKSILYNF